MIPTKNDREMYYWSRMTKDVPSDRRLYVKIVKQVVPRVIYQLATDCEASIISMPFETKPLVAIISWIDKDKVYSTELPIRDNDDVETIIDLATGRIKGADVEFSTIDACADIPRAESTEATDGKA